MPTIDELSRERTLINPLADRVKDVAALTRARTRARKGLFLVEGPQAVREALRSHAQSPLLDALYVTEEALERHPDLSRAVGAALGSHAPGGARRRLFARLVTPEVLAAMSDAQSPQGILAVADAAAVLAHEPWNAPPRPAEEAAASSDAPAAGSGQDSPRDPSPWPVLTAGMVRLQDPGNAGTLIRAADAAGAGGVLVSAGSVDVLNPKTVRSTVGSLFHLPVVTGLQTQEYVEAARRNGVLVLAADGHGDLDLDDLADDAAHARAADLSLGEGPAGAIDLRRPTLWLFGNEARGLTPQEKALADARVAVPVHGRAESLNVGTAATVCLYASARAQRPQPAGRDADAASSPGTAPTEPSPGEPTPTERSVSPGTAPVVGAALLEDSDRTLLVARRSAPPALAGLWEFPGGKVELGEAPREALARELHEELGVAAELGEELSGPAPEGWPLGGGRSMRVFLGRITEGLPHPLQDHAELRWLPVDRPGEIRALDWIPADRPIVEALLHRLARGPRPDDAAGRTA